MRSSPKTPVPLACRARAAVPPLRPTPLQIAQPLGVAFEAFRLVGRDLLAPFRLGGSDTRVVSAPPTPGASDAFAAAGTGRVPRVGPGGDDRG